jgi:peptide/nickel transport system permease protein
MLRFIARRLLIAVPILLGVSVLTFTFANLAPGDPISALVRPGSDAKPRDVEKLKEALGLNKPLPERYVTWLGQVVQGNLGAELVGGGSIAKALARRIPNTIKLMGTALAISLLLGVTLGILSAFRQHSKLDNAMTVVVISGISLPPYLLAILAIYFFAVVPFQFFGIKLLPAGGLQDPVSTLPPVIDELWHLILPALVLAFAGTATFLRYTRASVLEVMHRDFVTTARSKGLPERAVRLRHILRNALLPIVTVLGLTIPSLIVGAIFVETLFSWPGIGQYAIESTREHDYAAIMGVGLLTSAAIVGANLITDVAYAFVDPRIRVR